MHLRAGQAMDSSDQALAGKIAEVTLRRPSQPDVWFDPGYVFRIQAEERLFLAALRRRGLTSLKGYKILDVGCGYGAWLRRYVEWGASVSDLHGVDILEERIVEARRRCPPGIDLQCRNASRLDVADGSFDIISMSLVMSLIPDDAMRAAVGVELSRVLKPGGFILWYDFRYPPPRARGDMVAMTRRRIANAFPAFELDLRSASAVPPITRRLAPYAGALCTLLDYISPLNTHYVGTLIKRRP